MIALFVEIYPTQYANEWMRSLRKQTCKDYRIFQSLEKAIELPYVIFMDMDDVYYPGYISVMKSYLAYYEAVGCAADIVENNEKIGIFGRDTDIESFYAYGYGNVGYKSSLLKEALPVPDVEHKDLWLIREMLDLGASKYFIEEPHIIYRRYGQKSSRLEKIDDRYLWRINDNSGNIGTS